MEYIKVTNWDKYQQYKDRDPKWIKVYRDLLDDYEFNALPDASKFHLMGIWLLAAKIGNEIPADPKWIATRIGSQTPIKLEILVSASFLTMYTRDQESVQICTDLYVETETEEDKSREETETETETARAHAHVRAQSDEQPSSPHEEFQSVWNAMADSTKTPSGKTQIPRCESMSKKRRDALTLRLKDPWWRDHWRGAIAKIPSSQFLCGRTGGTWRANPEWFLRPDSAPKVLEGNYDDNRNDGVFAGDEGQFVFTSE